MARRTNIETQIIIDKVTNNYLGGITRPSEMMRKMGIDYKTAVKYMDIARQRIDELIKDTNREEILKRELVSLDYLENIAWNTIGQADNINHLAGVCNTIVKIKEKRIELLDLKNITYKIIKEEAIKEKRGTPLDFQSHDWLITKMQADGIIEMDKEFKEGKRDRYGNRIKEKKQEDDV